MTLLQQIANLPDVAITSLGIGQTATMIRAYGPTDTRSGTIERTIRRIDENHFIFVGESEIPQRIHSWEGMRIIPESQREARGCYRQPVRSIYNYSIINVR